MVVKSLKSTNFAHLHCVQPFKWAFFSVSKVTTLFVYLIIPSIIIWHGAKRLQKSQVMMKVPRVIQYNMMPLKKSDIKSKM